jgi:hypothetical protein
MPQNASAGVVTGWPRLLLRLEGLALLALALVLYHRLGASWWLFLALILAPDLSFAGYLAGERLGATVYNAFHTLIGPFALAIAGLTLPWFLAVEIAVIWAAHIGFDRAVGFGLKYQAGFRFTHLGRIGRSSTERA